MNIDLHAPYQNFADRVGVATEGPVSFSTGSQPWGYAAAIGLGIGEGVRAAAVEVEIETRDEPVYLLTVGPSYEQVGDRLEVPPDSLVQWVTVPLHPLAQALIVQASAAPSSTTVKLSGVSLQLI